MRNKKSIISTVVLVFTLLVGLSVMLYPIVSNWWNSKTQSKVVAAYQSAASNLSDVKYQEIIDKAREYNEKLAKLPAQYRDCEQLSDYEDILDITGTGIMGYITIPQIRVELPIYHGTSASVLNIAAGHLQGSSLPVGGCSTHAVISAHRGLPSAKLFSDLDQLVEGDTFTITVLKEVYTYEVDQISIVLPDETEGLMIADGEDYVTLTTCTPYGINTHRLLVRAKRVANAETTQKSKILADAVQLDSTLVAPIIGAPILAVLLIYWIFGGKKKKPFPHDDPLSVLFDNDCDKDGIDKKGG